MTRLFLIGLGTLIISNALKLAGFTLSEAMLVVTGIIVLSDAVTPYE